MPFHTGWPCQRFEVLLGRLLHLWAGREALDFYRLLKCNTPKTSPNRDHLMEGRLFVQLRGTKLEEEEEEDPAWRRALADLRGEAAGPCESSEVWWHIGHQSLSPYQSTMRPMRFVGEREVNGVTEVDLEARHVSSPPPVRQDGHPDPMVDVRLLLSVATLIALFSGETCIV